MSDETKPVRCLGGCGFWGSAVTGNMCSKCYKEAQAKKNIQPAVAPSTGTKQGSNDDVKMETESEKIETKEPEVKRKVQKNTSRCWSCKRRIGLLGFKCRCSYFFCSRHRYADQHDCDFDYKTAHKDQLREANPIIAARKVDHL